MTKKPKTQLENKNINGLKNIVSKSYISLNYYLKEK